MIPIPCHWEFSWPRLPVPRQFCPWRWLKHGMNEIDPNWLSLVPDCGQIRPQLMFVSDSERVHLISTILCALFIEYLNTFEYLFSQKTSFGSGVAGGNMWQEERPNNLICCKITWNNGKSLNMEVCWKNHLYDGGFNRTIPYERRLWWQNSSINEGFHRTIIYKILDFHWFSIFSIAMLASPKGKPMAQRHSELRRHEDEIRRELQKYPEHGWFTAVPKRYETGMGRKYTYRI